MDSGKRGSDRRSTGGPVVAVRVKGHLELDISEADKLRFERLLPLQQDVFFFELEQGAELAEAFRRAEAQKVS